MCQSCDHLHGSSKLRPIPPSLQRTITSWVFSSLSAFLVLVSVMYHYHISFLYLFYALLLLLVVLIVRAATIPSVQLSVNERQAISQRSEARMRSSRLHEKSQEVAQRLAAAIRCKTISYDAEDKKNKVDFSQLDKLHQLIESSFPLIHTHLEKTIINKYSVIYKWKGTDEIKFELAQQGSASAPIPAQRLPYLLLAHLDVVPADDAKEWTHPPFEGVITEGYVWGRGAIDDKQAAMGILEAVEDLLAAGFRPHRTLYFAFGHDEEISGKEGAKFVAQWFKEQNIKFEFVLDEGLFCLSGLLPGIADPVGVVCIAEKGWLAVEARVELGNGGGHSSTPLPYSAIGILAQAVKKLEDNPMPAYFNFGPARTMFDHLAAHFKWPFKLIFANLWLFAPLVKKILLAKHTSAPIARTTTALTIFNAGTKVNTLPDIASASINHRIHPEDSVAGVLAYDHHVINDRRVTLHTLSSIEPAPVSSYQSNPFKSIRRAVAEIIPEALVAPGIMIGNTDTQYFWDLAQQIFRFCPTRLHVDETKMFHGRNERISIKNYVEIIQFYQSLINDSDRQ